MSYKRTYADISQLSSFEDRFNYCQLKGEVGADTFGYDRYLNQKFYRSQEWKRVRDQVIIRDNGCDLGMKDIPIKGKIYIHHLNPLTLDDVSGNTDALLDPNNLICVSHATHNAIHFGDDQIVKDKKIVDRKPNDTCPWKK